MSENEKNAGNFNFYLQDYLMVLQVRVASEDNADRRKELLDEISAITCKLYDFTDDDGDYPEVFRNQRPLYENAVESHMCQDCWRKESGRLWAEYLDACTYRDKTLIRTPDMLRPGWDRTEPGPETTQAEKQIEAIYNLWSEATKMSRSHAFVDCVRCQDNLDCDDSDIPF